MACKMDMPSKESLVEINDAPFFWHDTCPDEQGSGVPFLVRFIGEDEPFGIVVAWNPDELFWLVDEIADPYQCEATIVWSGAFFRFRDTCHVSDELGMATLPGTVWRPVFSEDLIYECKRAETQRRAENLSKLQSEAAGIGKLIKGLGGKVHARSRKHQRHSKQDHGALGAS